MLPRAAQVEPQPFILKAGEDALALQERRSVVVVEVAGHERLGAADGATFQSTGAASPPIDVLVDPSPAALLSAFEETSVKRVVEREGTPVSKVEPVTPARGERRDTLGARRLDEEARQADEVTEPGLAGLGAILPGGVKVDPDRSQPSVIGQEHVPRVQVQERDARGLDPGQVAAEPRELAVRRRPVVEAPFEIPHVVHASHSNLVPAVDALEPEGLGDADAGFSKAPENADLTRSPGAVETSVENAGVTKALDDFVSLEADRACDAHRQRG